MKRIIVYLLCLLSVLSVEAQRYPYSETVVNKEFLFDGKMVNYDFLPYRRTTLDLHWGKLSDMWNKGSYSTANLTAMDNSLKDIYAILMSNSLLSNLQGVGAQTISAVSVGTPRWGNNGHKESFPVDFIRSHVSVGMNPYFRAKDGKVYTFPEYWKSILIRINDLSDLIFGLTVLPDYDYVTRVVPHEKDWMGCPVFHIKGYDRAIITNKDIPLYVPVTYREFMAAWFKVYEKLLTESGNAMNEMKRKVEQQIKDMDKDIENAEKKGLSASLIAQMKKNRDLTVPELQKMISKVKPEDNESYLKQKENIDAQRREMAGMTPAILDSHCKIWDGYSPLLRPKGRKQSDEPSPVMKINPELIDLAHPSDIQFLTVETPPYSELYDQEIGFYRHYWIIYQVMKDSATWQKIINKVKK